VRAIGQVAICWNHRSQAKLLESQSQPKLCCYRKSQPFKIIAANPKKKSTPIHGSAKGRREILKWFNKGRDEF
jgi:hypothetical protein